MVVPPQYFCVIALLPERDFFALSLALLERFWVALPLTLLERGDFRASSQP